MRLASLDNGFRASDQGGVAKRKEKGGSKTRAQAMKPAQTRQQAVRSYSRDRAWRKSMKQRDEENGITICIESCVNPVDLKINIPSTGGSLSNSTSERHGHSVWLRSGESWLSSVVSHCSCSPRSALLRNSTCLIKVGTTAVNSGESRWRMSVAASAAS